MVEQIGSGGGDTADSRSGDDHGNNHRRSGVSGDEDRRVYNEQRQEARSGRAPNRRQHEEVGSGRGGAPVKVVNNPEQCTDAGIDARDQAHVTTQKVEISERTLSVVAFGLAIAAFVTALWCMHEQELHSRADAREMDRLVHEVNVRNVLIQDHDALLYRAGIKRAGDLAKGPTGNIEFTTEELK